MGEATFLNQVTPTTYSVLALLLVFVVTLAKIWPLLKAKVNEARKIERDADADLRGDLLQRIALLEARCDAEPGRLDAALAAERRRCEGEMADMRRDFQKRLDELTRIITQNSRSAAQFLGGSDDLSGVRE